MNIGMPNFTFFSNARGRHASVKVDKEPLTLDAWARQKVVIDRSIIHAMLKKV